MAGWIQFLPNLMIYLLQHHHPFHPKGGAAGVMNDTSGSSNTSYVDRMLATYGPTPGANPPPHSLGHPHRVVGPVGVNSDWVHSGHNDTSWAEFGDVTVTQDLGLPYPPRIPGLSAALQWVEFLKVRVSIAHLL